MSPKRSRDGMWAIVWQIAAAYVRWGVKKLLTGNTKLDKIPGVATRYLVRGLALAPHAQSGKNVCPWAGVCIHLCVLWFAGRTVMENVRRAMIARAKWFHGDRESFVRAICREIEALVRAADRAGARPVVRLNVASDIVWERIAPAIFAAFPDVTFYDYTKAAFRHRPETPANYHLSHSFHEKTTLADVCDALQHGRNVVVVFDSTYNPRARNGRKYGALPARVTFTDGSGARVDCDVVDGDLHDVRIPDLDGRGRVVALRGKGGRARVADGVAAGFVQQHERTAALAATDTPRLDGAALVNCRG